MPKERADLGTGDEIASAAGVTVPRIEPVVGVVQRKFDDFSERQRSRARDPIADLLVEGRELPDQTQPPMTSETSLTVSTSAGQTPNANVAKTVRPRAAWSENGMRIGVTSPSGASSAHIVRRTDR